MVKLKKILMTLLVTSFVASTAERGVAVGSDAVDSHIHSYVYNENQIYDLITRIGYQSYIEIESGEYVTAISVGDSVAFKISPTGNKIFIRAMQDGYHTNMTVMTTKRTYQFELSSIVENDDDIMYVLRFYYPQEYTAEDVEIPSMEGFGADSKTQFVPVVNIEDSYNYNYSLVGAEELSPVKIFDDGKKTYFKFPTDGKFEGGFFVVTPEGDERKVFLKDEGEFKVFGGVASKMALRFGDQIICIYNES